MCDKWAASFDAFYADMGDPPDGMSLDRINNNSHYRPSNCRWATRAEQNMNKSDNRRLTLTLTETEWRRLLGFKRGVIQGRLNDGWSVRRALTEPLQEHQSRPAEHIRAGIMRAREYRAAVAEERKP